jgi:acetyl-CoA acyltransferase
MTTIQECYIVAVTRTPVAKRNGAFRYTRPDDLLAHALKNALAQCPGLNQEEISDVFVGCAMPEAEQGLNVARMGVLLAGMPVGVPAMTVNRYCSSGLNAVALAADRIRLGEADVAIGAGTESMSIMSQMFGNKLAFNPEFFRDDEGKAVAFGMGITAENVAKQFNISREQQDVFALASHMKASKAIADGKFRDEISPYSVVENLPDLAQSKVNRVVKTMADDEGARPQTTMESLGKLRPVFNVKGSVTAGNSSQMSDGAGAVVLMSESALKRYQLQPLGKFLSFAVAGVPPAIMGIGPIAAIPKALKIAGLTLDQMDHIELNEAFAAQALAVMQECNINPEVVNPYGGAIALGHPLGATGAIRTATIMHAMKRNKHRYGMVSMCIGTGMGAAGIFENLQR